MSDSKPSSTVVLFPGITGFDKTAIISKLAQDLLRREGLPPNLRHPESSKIVRHIKFDDVLKKVSGAYDIPSFLERQSLAEKTAAIERSFEKITKNLQANGYPKYVFIEIHLSYIKRSEFIPPINLASYEDLVPLTGSLKIITLMDDVFSIWKVIRARDKASFPGTALRLREVVAWRSVESLLAETLAINLTDDRRDKLVKNFLVSVRHPAATFLNLIMADNPVCAYLSFPITKTRSEPACVKDINAFRARMHQFAEKKGVVIFDPVAIDELILQLALKKARPGKNVTINASDRWPLAHHALANPCPYPVAIPYEQVEEVAKENPPSDPIRSDIENNIRARDYKLIDMSRLTVVYRPHYMGRSVGVAKEVEYSVNQGRKVILYDPDEDKEGPRSPFDESVEKHRNKDEFLKNVDAYLSKPP